jgi:Cys-tRNA(Pro)/Cys-tRNA(Cys) deacylase
MAATQGLKFLESKGMAVTLHPYDYDPNADAVGMAAARALGLEPGLTLKTLMVEVDGKPACCVIPSDRQLSMKKVAAAFGGKAAAMMAVPLAEKVTGYRVGGISPFGQKRVVPVAIEASVCGVNKVWINAGQRGLLLGIDPAKALEVLGARAAELLA